MGREALNGAPRGVDCGSMAETHPAASPALAPPLPVWQEEWLSLADGPFWTLGLLLVAGALVAAWAVGRALLAGTRESEHKALSAQIGPAAGEGKAAQPPDHDPFRQTFRGFENNPPAAAPALAAARPDEAGEHPRLGNRGF